MDFLRSFSRVIIALAALVLALIPISATAQLSPGELSKSHAFLEGLDNCGKCHGYEQQLSSDKCLACHTLLGERIKAKQGLHAGADYSRCELCHVEHQGREFELVYWKGGQKSFDHALTGYKLDGKHAGVDCRACHKEQNIVDKDRLRSLKKDLNRTFLGLKQECLSCHRDEHRGQMAAPCLSCHAMAGWIPPSGFSHDKARFTLTGKHIQVNCDKCHPKEADGRFENDKDYIKLTGLRFGRCLDCHKDPHENKLGQSCEGCHNTSGWQSVSRADFDHSKTRFPLQGKHAAVACDKCHLPGKSLKGVRYETCRACHADYHRGRFTSRQSRGACEECHTVAGFTPAKFGLDEHQKTKYPLAGSHLAVPCIACHSKTTGSDGVPATRFTYESTRCLACHKDPHKGQVDKFTSEGGCEFCHAVDSWRKTSFDHARTKLPLEGRHKEIACRACHRESPDPDAALKFTGLATSCQGCHQDIHRGQFAIIANVGVGDIAGTDCARCHTPASWKPERFDHNRDSAFKLDGAHLKVECKKCHVEITGDGKPFAKYKPLSLACSSCHGDKGYQDGGKKL